MEPSEIKPTLNVTLKLEVAKAPQSNKYHVLETAYVLEEIMQAVENGLPFLPPRQKQGKNKIINKVIEEKRTKMEEDEKSRKDQ